MLMDLKRPKTHQELEEVQAQAFEGLRLLPETLERWGWTSGRFSCHRRWSVGFCEAPVDHLDCHKRY